MTGQTADRAVPRHLPLLGLVLVLFGQLAMAAEAESVAIRTTFLVVVAMAFVLERSGLRLGISSDRARVFATVGIVGYVFFGLPQLDLRSADSKVEEFFTGLVLVFTVHQLGAILRLGKGGDAGPIYVASAIHMIGAANAQRESSKLPWLLLVWTALALTVMWRESAPPIAPARRRWLTRPLLLSIALMLVVIGAVGYGLPQLQKWMQSRRWSDSTDRITSGFNMKSARLGVIQEMKLTGDPVLRLFGEDHEGARLRAMTYADFKVEHDRWETTEESRVDPEDSEFFLRRTPGQGEGHRYGPISGAPRWDGERREFEVLLYRQYLAPTRPAPLGIEAIRVPEREDLMAARDAVVHVAVADIEFACRRYLVESVDETGTTIPAGHVSPLTEEELAIYVGDSAQLPGIVQELVEQVAGDAPSSSVAAQRIESFFAASGEFEYVLEVPPEYGVEEFLAEDGRRGWCEYYATCMTLMLRARGIPSRYVTGYVVGEWNSIGRYYVVRSWDAHAWVEAWFPESGWRTYDPTPPGMRRMEGDNHSGLLRGLWDWLTLTLGDTWRALTAGDFLKAFRKFTGGVLQALWGMLLQPVVTAICTIALLAVLVRIAVVGRAARRRAEPPEDTQPAEVRLLESSWRQILADVRAHGLPIHPGDTPRRVLAKLGERPTPGAPTAAEVAPIVELIYECRYGSGALERERVEEVCGARR